MNKKLVLRRYKEEDIKQCIVHVKRYTNGEIYSEGNSHYKGLDFDEEKMYKVLSSHVNDVNFFCDIIVADTEIVGGLCAYVATPIFSSETFAYDQFFCVSPDIKHSTAALRLIKSYIKWSERRKVKQCYLRTSTLYNETGFTKLCKKLGFEHYETGFAKEM